MKNVFVAAVALLSIIPQIYTMDYDDYTYAGDKFDPYTYRYNPNSTTFELRNRSADDPQQKELRERQLEDWMQYNNYLARLHLEEPPLPENIARARELQARNKAYHFKAIKEFNPLGDWESSKRREPQWRGDYERGQRGEERFRE